MNQRKMSINIIGIWLKCVACLTYTLISVQAEEEHEAWHSTSADCLMSQVGDIPTSVHYLATNNGQHVVTINGIGSASIPRSMPDDTEPSVYQKPIDSVAKHIEEFKLEIDYQRSVCRIVTTKELKISKIIAIINELALVRNDIPCWDELRSRDLAYSKKFSEKLYRVSKVEKKETLNNLAWYFMPRGRAFSAPFVIDRSHQTSPGVLQVVPVSGRLWDHPSYVIRILDQSGRLIWTDKSTYAGAVEIAVCDFDKNGEHEVCLMYYNSGLVSIFHISPNF